MQNPPEHRSLTVRDHRHHRQRPPVAHHRTIIKDEVRTLARRVYKDIGQMPQTRAEPGLILVSLNRASREEYNAGKDCDALIFSPEERYAFEEDAARRMGPQTDYRFRIKSRTYRNFGLCFPVDRLYVSRYFEYISL